MEVMMEIEEVDVVLEFEAQCFRSGDRMRWGF